MYFGLDELVLVSISVATATLGIVAYHRAPDRVWNRLFTVHAFAVSLWVLLNVLIQCASTVADAGVWIRLCHPVVAVVICTCVDLFWVFPERVELGPQTHRYVLYIIGLIFSTAGIFPNLYTSIELAHGTVIVEYGWPFFAFGVFTMVTLGYADYLLIRKSPHLSGVQRAQVNYVLTGMIIGQTTALVTMILLPLIWGNTYYSRWGSASYIFVIVSMAYAIAKHRIIRPVTALYRASAYLLTGVAVAVLLVCALVLVQPILEASRMSPTLVYALGGVVLGALVVPVHQQIRQALDRALPHRHVAEAIARASDAILRTLDAEQLPEFLSQTISSILYPAHVSVFTKDSVSGDFVCRSRSSRSSNDSTQHVPMTLPADSIVAQTATEKRELLERSHIMRFHSLEEAKLLLAAMREFDTEIVAPILWEDQLIGLVLIGEKLSGDMYAPDELAMLRNMMPQVSLATRNAQLYGEVVRINEYNENILLQMKSGVIAVDADQTIVLFNPAAEEILGISADQAINQQLDILPQSIVRCLREALAGSARHSEYHFHVRRPGGDTVPVGCSTTAWAGSLVSQRGAMAVISDLTIVEELERERQQAEHLAMIRVLSAGMAHEIRNPLVAIRTFAELLPSRWEDAEFRVNFLSTAESEIERIDRLLADLMMLSKPADAVAEEIDVDGVCEGVVRAMSARAEARGVELVMELHANGRQPVGDQSRLHQALLNLVTNALEAEPLSGLVRIRTQEAIDNQSSPIVVISVYNPNSHIPEAQLEEIFKPFYSRRLGGTGLGLAICQTIIEEHNGAIRVASEPDSGTEFIVELPLNSGNGEA